MNFKWYKDQDGCLDCGLSKLPHHSRGRCIVCYRKHVAEMKAAGTYQPRRINGKAAKRSRIDPETGNTQYRCATCREYFDTDSMNKGAEGRPGSYCKPCQNERARARLGDKAEHDRLYDLWKSGGMNQRVPIEVVEKWVAYLDNSLKDTAEVARTVDLDQKVLYNIRNRFTKKGKGTRTHVSFDTAQAIADGLGQPWAVNEWAAPDGRDDWSVLGYRSCRDCGTFFHPHQASGYCLDCYKKHNYNARHGGVPFLTRDAETRFSARLTCCQACKTTERKHVGRGLCTRCFQRFKKNGTLSEWPTMKEMDERDVGQR